MQQMDYSIHEIIGRVKYLAICSKYIVGEIFCLVIVSAVWKEIHASCQEGIRLVW